VGVQSGIYAQNNYFKLGPTPAGNVIHYWKGTAITATGNLVEPAKPLDLVAAYNAAHDPDLIPDAGWTPTARTHVEPAWAVPPLISLLGGSH
jgi:pectate lyase